MSKLSEDFVHLHVHTDYSLLDGACKTDNLCKCTHDMGMKAVALTDHGTLFGVVDFYKKAHKHGVKPLVGCEIYLVYDHKMTEKPGRGKHRYHHMGLLCKNFKGYQNLTKLVSDAHTEGFYYKPRTDMEHLAAHCEGLIGFTGCLNGVVPSFIREKNMPAARKAMQEFIDIFGKENFFVEIMNHGIDEEIEIIPGLLQLAKEFDLKVVCTNDVHYVNNTDWAPHDSLLCIQTGSRLSDEKRLRYSTREFYMKSQQEMEHLFRECPESVPNTRLVAEMCELELPFGENHYPVFTPPIEVRERCPKNIDYLKECCIEGMKERYGVDYHNPDAFEPKEGEPQDLAKTLVERLDYELGVIEKTGFIDYFLIVWDFIAWAREQGIPVGPGRGSGAGCIVAYLLKITDIDPIRFGLLFERFLNPERVSPPDFDIDFCMRRRARVIEYVREKYGHDCVANIITFGTFGAKMVIRDLARVNDMSFAEGDRIAKMIPDELGITVSESLEKSSELATEVRRNPVTADIVEQGQIIEGMVRNTGTHAAGVIIADRPLTEMIPVTLQDGALTTQYPKDPVEELGLLKMDFLGLKTLTIIADAEANVRMTRNFADFDIEKVSFEDQATFDLLNRGETTGVFQLESGGMQSLCRQFNLSSIDEIVALIALYRPGPMDWIPDYIRGKKDPSTIKVPHPLLEKISKETYGVLVYQEQVMEAARVVAGYTLGGADILRRAMGKKKPEEMAKQRTIFIEGAAKTNNIGQKKAEEIFDILEKFAGYGFNKSHSAAYAILAYRTAFLKANYPVEFMAAVLSAELGNADKVAHFIGECSVQQIPVLGPHINESNEAFTPIVDPKTGKGEIRFGLAAMKGVGDTATQNIIAERKKSGDYKDFSDFANRIDTRVVNRRVLECLIKAGAFDLFGHDRQHLLDSLDGIMSEVASNQKDKESGQGSLFDMLGGMGGEEESSNAQIATVKTHGPKMRAAEMLQHEKEILGFYVSGHPLDAYRGLSDAIDSFAPEELDQQGDQMPFRLCGVASGVTKRLSKRDNRPWAFFTLETRTTNYSLNCFADAFENFGHQLVDNALVIVTGTIRKRDGEQRFNVSEIHPLERRLPAFIRKLTMCIEPEHAQAEAFLKDLRQYAQRNEGATAIEIACRQKDGRYLCADTARSLSVRIEPDAFERFQKNPALIQVRAEAPALKVEEPSFTRRKK